jgi:hypothetical protein
MFTSGKRTTQRGHHSGFKNVSKNFIASLEPYLGRAENSSSKIFSYDTHHILAGSFICRFFKERFSEKSFGKRISFFDMDKTYL